MVAFATQVKRRRGTEAQNNEFTGAEGEIVVDLTNMTLRVHDGRTKGGFVVGGGAGRNIGDVFFTARTDTTLNGAVEANGGLYNTTDFVGAEAIGNILSAGKVPYVSLAEFETIVSANGSCRCFGWDGGTEFRVPKLSNVFVEAGIAATAGEFIPAGLPNITGTTRGCDDNSGGWSGAFYSAGATINTSGESNGTYGGFDASRSSPVYGNSDTVQPPAVKYRAMVQLANGATDEAVVVAENVLSDIAEIKVGEGFAQTGKNTIVGWGMPDYSAGVVVADGYQTTFPCFITLIHPAVVTTNSAVVINIDGARVTLNVAGGGIAKRLGTSCYVGTGHTITIDGSDGSPVLTVYPLKGVN